MTAWRTGRDGAQIKINPKQGRDGGLGEMGLSDEGERIKNEKEKGRKKRTVEREKERKDKIFF